MKTITEKEREKLNELLHKEIVMDMLKGDTIVLFEIIQNLSTTTAYYSLSDESQKLIKFKKDE